MKTVKNMAQFFFLFIIVSLFLFLNSSSASAVNICGVNAYFNETHPYFWDVGAPNYTMFNYSNTASATDINSVCWRPGLPWEEISITYKPFPNQCSSSYNAICTEDTDNYSSYRTYFTINLSKRYCINTDNLNWRWVNFTGGFQEIRATYNQTCSGGSNSIDNSCRAPLYFNRTRNGAVNYSSWNFTGTVFHVNQDVAAFSPTCYGALNGTVTDSDGLAIDQVNVTILISGPGVEKSFNSTLTDTSGNYRFNSIPATTYRVLFSKSNYNSGVAINKVNYTNTSVVNMTLTSGSCNYDCTTQADPSRCSAACNGVAGCQFHNATVATRLNGVTINSRPVIDIFGTNYTVLACEGTPVEYIASSIQSAQLSCPLGTTLVVLERIVLYNGQPVKIVVPVCRSS